MRNLHITGGRGAPNIARSTILGTQVSTRPATTSLVFQSTWWNNLGMVIGDRLRELREAKKLSQGHVEKRTGLLRCYISRVENGHTVPAVATLEKMARALEVPLYKLFYDGKKPAQAPDVFKRKSSDDGLWGNSGKDAKFLSELRRLMSKANEKDRKLI